MRIIFLTAIAVFIAFGPAAAETYGSHKRTSEYKIASDSLGEKRTIYVRTPPAYDPSKSYPVVYVLDGEWNFEYVASYLDYMADNEVYPDLIVTGVRNVNRNRDYVPRADPYFADTGEAGAFLDFVEKEWTSLIEEKYPASGERILIGHSFGGVFTLHTLFTKPALFDAYIALGASAWIGDRVLFEEAAHYFADPQNADAFVYMAVGEGDGGPTVPSGEALAALFQEEAPETLEWTFDVTPKTDHFKNVASGMHDAFMELFPAWGFDDEVMAAAAANGPAGVDQWFSEKEAALGWRFKPAWFDMGVAALALTGKGDGAAAMRLMEHMVRHYPDNAQVAAFAGNALEQNERFAEAAAEYERAIKIARKDDLHPNAIHLDRLEESAARNRAAAENEAP